MAQNINEGSPDAVRHWNPRIFVVGSLLLFGLLVYSLVNLWGEQQVIHHGESGRRSVAGVVTGVENVQSGGRRDDRAYVSFTTEDGNQVMSTTWVGSSDHLAVPDKVTVAYKPGDPTDFYVLGHHASGPHAYSSLMGTLFVTVLLLVCVLCSFFPPRRRVG